MGGFKRIAGISALLLAIIVATTFVEVRFLSPYNLRNVLRWTGLFGLLSLGTAFVIVTGGIDLSTGSMVALIGTLTAFMLTRVGTPIWFTILLMAALSIGIGTVHGLLVTKIRVQPFVVTLCGLFIYRGMARFAVNDMTQGYGVEFQGLRGFIRSRIPGSFWPGGPAQAPGFILDWSLPMAFVILLVLAVILAIVLNKSVYGRHLLALGRNERAARYSGVKTHKIIIIAYIISSGFAGLAGLLFSLDLNTVQPSATGQMYELYAIAGCVIGGVSLRGGEGNITGVIIGTAIVRVLYNSINMAGIATQLEFAVLGFVILIGVAVDEVVKMAAERRRRLEAVAAEEKAAAQRAS